MKLKRLGAVLVAASLVGALASCGSDSAASSVEEEESAGFNEVDIFDEPKTVAFLECNAVYFQACDLTDGQSSTTASCHLELDVKATENDYGYGKGDWVPYLTIEYVVSQNGATVDEGTFMPMAASDGPHYGANVTLNGSGTYDLTFTIKFPDTTTTYLIHTDETTGPESSVYPETQTISVEWDYKEGEWEI
ncbi:MAG: iron transporter [Acholeplasmatales bacterium]|nr:iron transporter [Acholeplasmatales bacterium]